MKSNSMNYGGIDSDSDDELMNALASGAFGQSAQYLHEDCAYCAVASAAIPCTSCNSVFYCSETCKRRHFKAHRAYCITTRMQNAGQKETDEEEFSEDEDEQESDSDYEENYDMYPRTSRSSKMFPRASAARSSLLRASSSSFMRPSFSSDGIPLTDAQIKKLLDLSAKAESSFTNNKKLEQIQNQVAELMAMKKLSVKNQDSEQLKSRAAVKLNDIKELQKKLSELEKRTSNITNPYPSSGKENEEKESKRFLNRRNSSAITTAVVYTPLLVKHDDQYRKYFKLKDMSMPIDQIKAKMKTDGVDPNILDTPTAVSPNDLGPPEGAYIPMTIAEDPKFKKYFKLQQMNMPDNQIRMKMEVDGVDPSLLDHPEKVSPNDPGPPIVEVYEPKKHPVSISSSNSGSSSSSSNMHRHSIANDKEWNGGMGLSEWIPRASSNSAPTSRTSYVPLLVKQDPAFSKYFKLVQMGMPIEQVKFKMSIEGLDSSLIEQPDDISPNDPGPSASSSNILLDAMDTITGSKVSLEQVFAILMQHQQIIQGGNFGSALNSTSKQSAIPIQNISIEDQMKNELQMVENVVEDIFGTEEEEQQQQQSLAASKKNTSLGMSMIEQLEKKARRENNKKLVKSREALNKLVEKVLITNFHSDEEAIAFYQRVHLEFEQCGLVLGTDAIQTWSARLLIKNKETREWYFNEKERFDAGKAYQRLWSMSFLERDVGQLITKKKQILNAPETFKVMVKNKLELMEKFIGLLKDAVKIKHKIFKNPLFVEEKKRLQEFDIPEKFEERSKEMIDASIVLAHASLGLAEEEFRVLNRTTRAIKIRASVAVGVAERAISLVEIVKKIGAQGIDEARLQRVQEKMVELQEKYLGTLENEEEEEEDDVL